MEYQCKVCFNDVTPINVKQNREEWSIEVCWECPICTSEYNGDTVTNRAEGERCDNCGDWVKEVVENGDNFDCKECLMEAKLEFIKKERGLI